ncbi:MAG: hypothetical protein GC191_14590 [Azospirillum sp.]|nr:hypothetical protein [Azospirillum sp.]
MPIEIVTLALAGLLFSPFLGAFGTIETGNVGVQTRFGTVAMEETQPGIYFAPFASIREFSAKEIAVSIDHLTPKAADNLFIKNLDLTVYYKMDSSKVAEIETKYAGQSRLLDHNVWAPAYRLIETLAWNAAYQEVSKLPSLVVHQQRDTIALHIQQLLQHELNESDPKVFTVARVVIRNVVTDPAIEAAIQQAVNNQKKLEAMEIAVRIAEKEAEVRLKEAQGIAKANEAINNSLTPSYLQHESNKALMEFAQHGSTSTVVIPANMNFAPLLTLPTGQAGGR